MNMRSHASAKMHRDVYHALDYLTYASLQLGQDAQAGKWVKFVESNQTLNEQTRQIAYAAAVIPARYALERGEWAKAAQLSLRPASPTFDWTPFPEGEAVNAYARGLGAARSGNAAAAKAEVARIGKLREAMVTQKKDYWIEQADIQVDTIRAWIARAEGRNEEALKLMRAAADREDKTEEHIMMPGRVIPVREMLGELLLDLKRPIAALAAFEESQRGDPRRFRNVYGAGRAAELAGKRDKARANYSQLLQQVGTNAAGRPEIEHAKEYVAKL
jgi:tetratricopeptide (TPR) repeat protein